MSSLIASLPFSVNLDDDYMDDFSDDDIDDNYEQEILGDGRGFTIFLPDVPVIS